MTIRSPSMATARPNQSPSPPSAGQSVCCSGELRAVPHIHLGEAGVARSRRLETASHHQHLVVDGDGDPLVGGTCDLLDNSPNPHRLSRRGHRRWRRRRPSCRRLLPTGQLEPGDNGGRFEPGSVKDAGLADQLDGIIIHPESCLGRTHHALPFLHVDSGPGRSSSTGSRR